MSRYKHLHFLLIYPLNTAPSQRFRFEQYFPLLDQCGIKYNTNCFYDYQSHAMLYQKKNRPLLLLRLIFCFFRRCIHIFLLSSYDCILIQRGAAPFGPPVFEWVIKYVYRKPIIYDFDDAIWLGPIKKESLLMHWTRSRNKIAKICKWSEKIVAGNQYLAEYARQYNQEVTVIPTVVNTNKEGIDKIVENEKIIIGWTGSHTTLTYLESLEDVLLDLKREYDFRLMVMANKKPGFRELDYQFVPWSEKAEIEELRKIDIGIMPLPDDEWTKGKCGFKAIQYMALGKPAVVSAVGVNTEIVDHGINGFVCYTEEDWKKYLGMLINDRILRKKMGTSAYNKVDDFYSLKKGALAWCNVL